MIKTKLGGIIDVQWIKERKLESEFKAEEEEEPGEEPGEGHQPSDA